MYNNNHHHHINLINHYHHILGCNSVNDYHLAHTGYEHLVVIEKIKVLSIEKFLFLHQIRNIKLLKIDTEGHDIVILNGFLSYFNKIKEYFIQQKYKMLSLCKQKHINSTVIIQYLFDLNHLYSLFHPNHIIFESNALVPQQDIQDIIKEYGHIGYECISSGTVDTILKKTSKLSI